MRIWIIVGVISFALAIVLGAFSAHLVKPKLSPADFTIFETGVRYHIYNSLGLILIGLIGFHVKENIVIISALMIITGIILFSGSLYILVFSDLRWLGAITPFGCISLITGWVLLAFNLIRN